MIEFSCSQVQTVWKTTPPFVPIVQGLGRDLANYWGPGRDLMQLQLHGKKKQNPKYQEQPAGPHKFTQSNVEITAWGNRTCDSYPRGSKYPIFKVSGPRYHLEYSFWNQKPQYWVLGPSGYVKE